MLRPRIVSFACCFIAAVGATSASAQEAIRWAPNETAAINMASRQNQLVLLHFWAPGCGPCVALERNVFSRPEVAQAINRDFVAVKINASAMPETARKYKVDRWPMDVIITPAGYPVHSMVSPQDPREYTQILYRVAAQRRPGERIGENTTGPSGERNSWGQDALAQAQGTPVARHDSQPQFGQSAFGHETRSAPSDNGWGGQSSQFGPSYGSQVDAGVAEPRPQFGGAPNQQPTQPSPRETVNPYAADAAPRGQFGPDQQRAAVQPPTQPQVPAGPPPLGLDGYCPVTLIKDGKWSKGDQRLGIIHRGRVYLFTSEEAKHTFWQDPDRYAPILSGNDPVEFAEGGRVIQGNRRHGVFFRNQIFLFTSEESLQRFWNSPQRYADVAVQAMARASAGRQLR